jgi:hypothetical protein
MASILLDLQRRFERRWAAKFFFRPDPNEPKNAGTQNAGSAAGGSQPRQTKNSPCNQVGSSNKMADGGSVDRSLTNDLAI